MAQTQSRHPGTFLLSGTNLVQGSTYDVRVYVVAEKDTVARISRKFLISINNFRTLNPSWTNRSIRVGETVRVEEKLEE